MRLVGDFKSEKEAYTFYSFLIKQGVQSSYEPFIDPQKKEKAFHVWIIEEDDFEIATELLAQYRENPTDVKYSHSLPPVITTAPPVVDSDLKTGNRQKMRLKIKAQRSPFAYAITHFFLLLCVFLFLWNQTEEIDMAKKEGVIALQIGLTPIQKELLFDYPSAYQLIDDFLEKCPIKSDQQLKDLSPAQKEYLEEAERAPYWRGLLSLLFHTPSGGWKEVKKVPLFERIREGEVWRFFTPCLLHRDFLHILFNMIWLWILGKQMEVRMRRYKLFIFILLVGALSNAVQYLMTGPYFLGFSGVVVAMVGFIWMRQRVAPWEGYPLQRGTELFILFFVLAMFALEVISGALQYFSLIQQSPSIANTAHIVGGLLGMGLGRLSFFSRGVT